VRKLAYLLPSFPELAQTFILGEIVELERLGVPLAIYSLRRPRTTRTQREAETLKTKVYYCPAPWAPAALADTLRLVVTQPGTVLRLGRVLLGASGGGRAQGPSVGAEGIPARMSLYERLRGKFHTGRLFTLAKNAMFIPVAVHLARRLRREGLHCLHAHWASHPATVALLINELTGIPFSFTAHAYDIYMTDFLLREKLSRASKVVTCAEANRRYIAATLGESAAEKVSVCYHGVDLARFQPGPARLSSAPPLLIACGNLEAYKGFEYLIEACAALRRWGIPFRCKIVGEGPRRRALEKRRDALGLTEVVSLPGAVTHEELLPELARADICVMPSVVLRGFGKRDVIPNIAVEAIASGVPVVASSVGGMAEAIEHGVNGYLVPQGDPDALARAIASLLSNPRQRRQMGKAGRERALRFFDRRKNAARLAQILGLEVRPDRGAGGEQEQARQGVPC